MMSNRFTDALFQLIQSLEKAEKRHFKLYIRRSSSNEDLKIVQLFDALDKMKDYDETALLKKLSPVTKPQLANLKAHLYKQLLAALRLLKTSVNIDLQLSELLDNARVLYNKGLKLQSFKMLERAKEVAKSNHKYNFLFISTMFIFNCATSLIRSTVRSRLLRIVIVLQAASSVSKIAILHSSSSCVTAKSQ